MKPYKHMTDRELLIALVRRNPGCTSQFLLERFNEVRMVDRPRMKSIIDTAKIAGVIKSGRVHGCNESGRGCSLATYWPSDYPAAKVPEVARPIERPSLSDVLLPRDRRKGPPDLPEVNAHGYVRGTVPTLRQAALMLLDVIRQPMEPAT